MRLSFLKAVFFSFMLICSIPYANAAISFDAGFQDIMYEPVLVYEHAIPAIVSQGVEPDPEATIIDKQTKLRKMSTDNWDKLYRQVELNFVAITNIQQVRPEPERWRN